MSEKLPVAGSIQPSPAYVSQTSLRGYLRLLARAVGNVFIALIGAYGLNLTVFLVLRDLVGERWTLLALFNSFLHLMLIPPLVFMPLCLLLRRRRLALTQLPAVLVFVVSYGPLFIPPSVRAAQISPEAVPIRVLTYNLKSEEDGFELLAGVIDEADADIVAMQEVGEGAANFLATEFADEYPYQAFHPQTGEPIPGQGVLSRYPILSDEYWRIYLGHQRVTLDVAGTAVVVYNLHPVQPLVRDGFDKRAEEISAGLERTTLETLPTLMVGDFNMSDQSDAYRQITSLYADVWHKVGWGMGFIFPAGAPYFRSIPGRMPSIPEPLVRIDYIFHDEAFQALEARVLPSSGGSDHRPLFARLALGASQ